MRPFHPVLCGRNRNPKHTVMVQNKSEIKIDWNQGIVKKQQNIKKNLQLHEQHCERVDVNGEILFIVNNSSRYEREREKRINVEWRGNNEKLLTTSILLHVMHYYIFISFSLPSLLTYFLLLVIVDMEKDKHKNFIWLGQFNKWSIDSHLMKKKKLLIAVTKLNNCK